MDTMKTFKEFAKEFVAVYAVVATVSMTMFFGLERLCEIFM